MDLVYKHLAKRNSEFSAHFLTDASDNLLSKRGYRHEKESLNMFVFGVASCLSHTNEVKLPNFRELPPRDVA